MSDDFLDVEDLLAELVEKNREKAKRKRARDAARRERGRKVVKEWFEQNPCSDCGNDDLRVLEADHVVGTRSFTIAESLWRPVKQIEMELKKCASRCCNCHRLRYSGERQQFQEWAFDELL